MKNFWEKKTQKESTEKQKGMKGRGGMEGGKRENRAYLIIIFKK